MNQPAWVDTSAYPFTPHYLDIDGHKMHYVDEGKGDVILFVHGTPSWSFEYRNIIKDLSANYRCIAFDHIGFGLSDKPADYDYSLQNHRNNLEKFITALQLSDFILVVHDFGGPIGLSYATAHPEEIKKLILFNTWAWSIQEEKEFKKMKRILGSPLVPFLYKYMNFSAKYMIPASFGERKRLTKEIHDQYIRPFSKPSERMGPLAFAKALLHQQDFFADVWNRLSSLKDIPVLIMWGMKDEFLTEKYLAKFLSVFPGASVTKYPDAGHFVMEEKSAVSIPVIREFLLK